jgi:peptidoglycan/xylan/chitin deacetylase (PgdA/CDA1 family)
MLRLDRFLTLYCFQPLLKIARSREPRVPVLMYHSISEGTSKARHPYYEIRTSPSVFRSHMTLLHDAGFSTLFPSEIAPWLASPDAETNCAVCLTFDDGYEDFLTSAFPILQELAFKSTVYVPTGLIGKIGPANLKLLSWSQIQELSLAEVNIGSHTVSHSDMTTLTKSEIIQELADSKQLLQDILGIEIKDFSHPYAFPEKNSDYMSLYWETLQRCGYKTAVTTAIGTVTRRNNPLFIKRIPVNLWDDQPFLVAKLNNAYSWTRIVQSLHKAFFSSPSMI